MDCLKNTKNITTFSQPESLFQTAAKDFFTRATAAIQEKGYCNVVLSGGQTPKKFYTAVVNNVALSQKMAWGKIRFFFGDERYVAADDPQSNYHTAKEYLFSKLPIAQENIFRMPTELPNAMETAKQYETTLKKIFTSAWPTFDITYLGMGDNGHTASLMPFTDLVKDYIDHPGDELLPWVAGLWVAALKMYRITLTPPAINHSKHIIFLVEGIEKAAALKEVLIHQNNPLQYPAIMIQQAHWFVDTAAASQLEPLK